MRAMSKTGKKEGPWRKALSARSDVNAKSRAHLSRRSRAEVHTMLISAWRIETDLEDT